MTLQLITGSVLYAFVAKSCNLMAINCPRLMHLLPLQQSMILVPVRVTFITVNHTGISSFLRFQIYLFYFGNACEFILVFHIGGGSIFLRAVGVY